MYIRKHDQFQRDSRKALEKWTDKYRTDEGFRREYLARQRRNKTSDFREKASRFIYELEQKWNVEEMTEREEMALLAGLILGEGYIGFIQYENKNASPVIDLSNTDLDIIALMNKLLPGIKNIEKKVPYNQKAVIHIITHKSFGILEALIKTRPYLVGRKLKIANMMIDIIKYRLLEVREEKGIIRMPRLKEMMDEITILNRRGSLRDR